MTSNAHAIGRADLRPMPYGRTRVGDVRNALYEPLWGGRRVLIDVDEATISIRDEHGNELAGYDQLREAIGEATQTVDAVLDGYLLPAPLRDATGADSAISLGEVTSAAEMSRQLLFGRRRGGRGRDEAEAARARRFPLPPSSPTAFVAIDLLWLDGTSLVDIPLAERKRLLDSVLLDGDVVRRTMTVRAPVEAWFAQWRALGFHEFAAKDANSHYTPGVASPAWATALLPKR